MKKLESRVTFSPLVEKLSDEIVRIEYPTYTEALNPIKQAICDVKYRIGWLLQTKINKQEMSIFPILTRKRMEVLAKYREDHKRLKEINSELLEARKTDVSLFGSILVWFEENELNLQKANIVCWPPTAIKKIKSETEKAIAKAEEKK